METESQSKKAVFLDYAMITLAALILDIGVYVFKFPNNFSFGGVTGIAVVLAPSLPLSASTLNFIINMLLLVLGLFFLGKSFAARTVYASVVISVILSALEHFFPMDKPLTNEPVLELIFAIILPAASSAILFNIGSSGGGTDIIAMILKKYTSVHIGTALLFVDLIIVVAACFTFSIETGLFSLCGLLAKSLVIDSVIENLNLCKYFTIVCDDARPRRFLIFRFWEMQTKESNFHSAQTLYAETWISFCLIRLVMRYICWIRRTLWKRCSL